MSQPPASQVPADRSRWTNLIVFAAIVLVVFAVFRFRPFGTPHPEDHAAVGRPLLVLDVEPLTGDAEPITRDELKGKVVLLSFLATSYEPCREELPRLAAIAKELEDRPDFKLLAISCYEPGAEDVPAVRRRTEKVLKELKLDLPTYADPAGATEGSFHAVAKRDSPAVRELPGYPTTCVLDRNLIIRGVWEGFRPGIETEMQELVEQLLGEPE